MELSASLAYKTGQPGNKTKFLLLSFTIFWCSLIFSPFPQKHYNDSYGISNRNQLLSWATRHCMVWTLPTCSLLVTHLLSAILFPAHWLLEYTGLFPPKKSCMDALRRANYHLGTPSLTAPLLIDCFLSFRSQSLSLSCYSLFCQTYQSAWHIVGGQKNILLKEKKKGEKQGRK